MAEPTYSPLKPMSPPGGRGAVKRRLLCAPVAGRTRLSAVV
ncbi:MAG: hypothetical protein M0026_16670 [Nocardiopsaceae bacterium]|nr:hypothetical protein [Nocardiopsaceae bacterium]